MDYIKIEHVNKQFGKEHVLRNVNISFEAGKIHGLIGRNGCGKNCSAANYLWIVQGGKRYGMCKRSVRGARC